MNIAQNIVTRLATEVGLTDQKIADLVCSTQPTIWRIRTGQTRDCAASLYVRLSGLLIEKLGAGEAAPRTVADAADAERWSNEALRQVVRPRETEAT